MTTTVQEELWARHAELNQLLWCLQDGEGFNLYVCQYVSVSYRQQLTALLAQQCPVLVVSVLSLDKQQLIDEGLQAFSSQQAADIPIFVYDLERFLLTLDKQRNLQCVRQLNWRRSAFQRLQRSVVLWLPLAALDLLARYAPDFYDWCSGFYYFPEPQTAVKRFEPKAFENSKTDNLSLTEKQSWLAVLQESLQDTSLQESERAKILRDIGDLHYVIGNDQESEICFQQALTHYQSLGDEKSIAVTQGRIANILYRRGKLDEALRIRQQEQMPVYERLGDVRERALTLGKIADILKARGELDEALRIRQQEVIPVFERLGDIRERAVCFGRIADILQARGQLDEALRIRQQEEMPVYERLGNVQARAVTLGYIAGTLQARGELDEALRIFKEELIPVFELLGDVRQRAVTLGKIADILQARGDIDEALRIRQQEEMPVYERLGDVRSLLITQWQIALQYMKMIPPRSTEANQLLCQALQAARKMQIPEAGQIEEILQDFGMASQD